MSRIRKGIRPLLGGDDIEQTARAIFAGRKTLYAECADLMVINESVSARSVAKRIYDEIYKTGKR